MIYAVGALLFTQAGLATATADQDRFTQLDEVAFEQVTEGHASEAVTRLEALLQSQPDDPALLINLAAAQIQLGRYDKAADCYRQAIASQQRYDLELAGGLWVDSRLAARRALAALEGQTLAMR